MGEPEGDGGEACLGSRCRRGGGSGGGYAAGCGEGGRGERGQAGWDGGDGKASEGEQECGGVNAVGCAGPVGTGRRIARVGRRGGGEGKLRRHGGGGWANRDWEMIPVRSAGRGKGRGANVWEQGGEI